MRLLSVALFDPGLSTDECTAADNILCFHPPDVHSDEQLNEVGFCIGLMRLQERFGVAMTAGGKSGKSRVDAERDASRQPRSITLARKRLTIIPIEGETFVCVATAREVLKSNLASIPTLPVSHAPSVKGDQQPNQAPQRGRDEPLERDTHGAVGVSSCAYFDADAVIPSSKDELDESVVDVIASTVDACHRMFTVMFGSVQWNYRRVCVLENDERLGLRRRPKAVRNAEDQEYMDERAEQRLLLERVLRQGLLNRLVASLSAATSLGHCLEGSFACPEGVDILRSETETHLLISSFVSQISNAHPGAIRDTLVVRGMQTVFSTLSVRDTTTLFLLMKFYNSARVNTSSPSPLASPPSTMPRDNAAAINSNSNRQHLRQSLRAGLAGEFAEEARSNKENQGTSCYNPESVLKSEMRRSGFLRSQQRFVDDPDEGSDTAIIPPGSTKPVTTISSPLRGQPSSTSIDSLAVSDGVAFGFPFIFLGDDDPVGVYTQDIGDYRFMFLVNEKYLRVSELRSVFEASLQDCIHGSVVAKRIEEHCRRSHASSMARQSEKSSPLRQSMAIEAEYLFYYRSPNIAQVRSSITQRLPPCVGSLVRPLTVDEYRAWRLSHHPKGQLSTGGSSSAPSWLRQTLQRRDLSSVPPSSSSFRESSVLFKDLSLEATSQQLSAADKGGRPLSVEDRQAIYLLNALRSHCLGEGDVSSPRESGLFVCARVRRDTWAFVMRFGSRDLSCVVNERDLESAEIVSERLARLVFFYAYRPPGL